MNKPVPTQQAKAWPQERRKLIVDKLQGAHSLYELFKQDKPRRIGQAKDRPQKAKKSAMPRIIHGLAPVAESCKTQKPTGKVLPRRGWRARQ